MRTLLIALAGLCAGVLLLAGLRFALAAPAQKPHYHANFAVFVEGERVDFSPDEYMEEIGACKVGGVLHPTERAHLHNNDPDVVHVHDQGVTWGQLLANLGWGLGERYLASDDGRVRVSGQGGTLKLILNGRPEFAVDNQLIRSGDLLLVSFGPETEAEVLRTQFPRVADDAQVFNQRQDPAGCSGSEPPTLGERLRDAFVG
jgi:hypothetical protein